MERLPLRAALERFSGRVQHCTETERRSDAGNQPQYYEDVLIVLQEETWVHRLFFFHYTDGPGQGNGGFGIVNEDLSPKPAHGVLQTVLQPPALAGD